MGIHQHVGELQGKPIEEYDPEVGILHPTDIAYRLSIDYDSEYTILDLFSKFAADPNAGKVTHLVFGLWNNDGCGSSEELVEAIVNAKLANLSALFLGDIIQEESEISWIVQCNLSALFQAYPQLNYLKIRGNDGLSLGEMKLDKLKTLIIEAGGLSLNVIKEVFHAQLPELEYLELWLGDSEYGGDATPEDLEPLLNGSLFPELQYLGLRNSAIADQVGVAVANAAIVKRLKIIDLSLGNLGDVGATALLASPLLTNLEKLDLHHHYISDELTQKLNELGIVVDTSELQEPYRYGNGIDDAEEEHRYIMASE
jgi:hypothetical protein